MRRLKRRKGRIKRLIKLFAIFAVLIIIAFALLISQYARIPLSAYAEQKAMFIGQVVINEAIRKEVVDSINVDEMVSTKNNMAGDVTTVEVNTATINMILSDIGRELADELLRVESDKNSHLNQMKIAFGALFQNTALTSFGPDVTITMYPVGSIKTDIETKLTPHGINNTLLEMNLMISVNFVVVAPFKSKEISVTTSTPILVEIINGEVPRYYYYAGSNYVPNVPNDDGVNESFIEPDLPGE